MAEWTYRCEFVKCSKAGCACGFGSPHGPYWYRYRREAGKVRKEYVGKERFKPDSESGRPDAAPLPFPIRWLDILNDGKASLHMAREILGVGIICSREQAARAFRERIRATHPDAGGHEKEAACVIAAWNYMKAVLWS